MSTTQLRFKHTKGVFKHGTPVPCEIAGKPYYKSRVTNEKGVYLATVYGKDVRECLANAKLVKTAPDMIKTLNAARSAIFNHGQRIKNLDPVEWFDRLSQIIGSATDSN